MLKYFGRKEYIGYIGSSEEILTSQSGRQISACIEPTGVEF
jgi:hypothetical protein